MPGLHSKRQADAAMVPGMLLGGQAWPGAAGQRQALDIQHGRNDQHGKGEELQERRTFLLSSAHSPTPQDSPFPAAAPGQAHTGDTVAAARMGSARSAPTPHYPGAPASGGGGGGAHPAVVDWAAAAAMYAMQSTATMACSQGGAHMQTGQSGPARHMSSPLVHRAMQPPQQCPAEQAAAACWGHVVGQATGGMSNSDAGAMDAEQLEQLESASQLQPGGCAEAAASHQVAQVASEAAGGGRRKRGRREDKDTDENTDEMPDAAGRARKRTAQA